ncbi:MAG TPA: cytosolic protein, partial [bacterium]|nr:cytosolic protein [bacterium]
MNKKIKITSDYDLGWKEIIQKYFEDGMKLLYPELDKIIDYKKGYKFLDKEISEIIGSNKKNKKVVDSLVEVHLKNGEEKWLLLHIEFQQAKEKEFEIRIYIYNYRIFNKYKKETISFVILGDKDKNWRPNEYKIEYPEFLLHFKYKLVKLIDFETKKDELLKSKNPFALIILSHLKRLEAGNDVVKQFRIKKELVKNLYNLGFNKNDIRNIIEFIDCLFQLPKELEEEYIEEIRKYEEVKRMPLMLTAEKLGIEKGIGLGREQGMYEVAKRMYSKG